MAFASTIVKKVSIGNGRRLSGTYTMAQGDVGGSVDVGMNNIDEFDFIQTDATDGRDVGKRLSTSGTSIVLDVPGGAIAAHSGTWHATGNG